MKMSKDANYGNWVPTAMMKTPWGVTAVLCSVNYVTPELLLTD